MRTATPPSSGLRRVGLRSTSLSRLSAWSRFSRTHPTIPKAATACPGQKNRKRSRRDAVARQERGVSVLRFANRFPDFGRRSSRGSSLGDLLCPLWRRSVAAGEGRSGVLAHAPTCPHCAAQLNDEDEGRVYSRVVGVEYPYGHPDRYDGVSEWLCPDCGVREGRWTGRVLGDGDTEPRHGGPSRTHEVGAS